MKSLKSLHVYLLTAGLILGSLITYQISHREAREHYLKAINKVPKGYLIFESKKTFKLVDPIDLEGNYGSSPEKPIKLYGAKITYNSDNLSISYAYIGNDTQHIGDDILVVRLEFYDGTKRDFILNNGKYGKLFETNDLVLNYSQIKETRLLKS